MPVHPIDPLHADLVRYFEERETIALDREDVTALRAANDYVAFFWTHGIGYLRSVRKGRVENGYRHGDAERYVPIRTEFDLHSKTTKPGFCVAVAHVGAGSGNEGRMWHTIAASLRAGDMLAVRWVPGNTSQAMRERGEAEDQCWLEVWPHGAQERRKVYLIDKWHGAAAHSFRMCRGSENQ
jgi:hypothetical protein